MAKVIQTPVVSVVRTGGRYWAYANLRTPAEVNEWFKVNLEQGAFVVERDWIGSGNAFVIFRVQSSNPDVGFRVPAGADVHEAPDGVDSPESVGRRVVSFSGSNVLSGLLWTAAIAAGLTVVFYSYGPLIRRLGKRK